MTSNRKAELIATNLKHNREYWDTIENKAFDFVADLLAEAQSDVSSIDDGDIIDISKSLLDVFFEMLKESYGIDTDAAYPTIDCDY